MKLIDKELRKRPEERADMIFLVIDTDTIVADTARYREYLENKQRYKAQGVVFIESQPCVELWFVYHLMERYSKTSFASYAEIEPLLKSMFPGYDKSDKYYRKNRKFREEIFESYENRMRAIVSSIQSCKYVPIEGELANRTEIFKAIRFFRLLQKFTEIKALILEHFRTSENILMEIKDHHCLRIFIPEGEEKIECCLLKYTPFELHGFVNGLSIGEISDTQPLAKDSIFMQRVIEYADEIMSRS